MYYMEADGLSEVATEFLHVMLMVHKLLKHMWQCLLDERALSTGAKPCLIFPLQPSGNEAHRSFICQQHKTATFQM